MRKLVRENLRFFLLATLAAFAARLLFVVFSPRITADSFVYGDIAKNWLQHGLYGLSSPDGPSPTYIRLPGYPAFLAAVFAVFGMEHYRAVLVLQMFADIGTCFLIADMARRMLSPRAAKAAFLLAAFCPFLVNYAAAALTETLEIFFTALAFDLALAGLDELDAGKLRPWVGCGLAVAAAILLRPDGGLLLIAIAAYLLWIVTDRVRRQRRIQPAVKALGLVLAFSLLPLLPWAFRNLRTMGEFQPLAPRYANDVGEFVPLGFNRWTKTWMADYTSVEELYWQVPGSTLDVEKLPTRAFDSESQREQTEELLQDYNETLAVSPELDARFEALADQRIHASLLRYYLWLPVIRIADMWLRPRTELLASDPRWWEFDDEPQGSATAVALGVINLAYLLMAFAGLVRGRFAGAVGLLLTFVVLRSLFLGTLENPETRYTLECYPVVIVLASALWSRSLRG